jgi:hypothetical protein
VRIKCSGDRNDPPRTNAVMPRTVLCVALVAGGGARVADGTGEPEFVHPLPPRSRFQKRRSASLLPPHGQIRKHSLCSAMKTRLKSAGVTTHALGSEPA